MIDIVRNLPGWIIGHPWWATLAAIALLAAFSIGGILLNPEGRQVRELWRRK